MAKGTVLKAVAIRTAALLGAFWFLAMSLLTWVVAEDMLLQVKQNMMDFVLHPPGRERGLELYPEDLPGVMEVGAMGTAPQLYLDLGPRQVFPLMTDPWLGGGISNDSPLWGRWSLIFGLDAAVVYSNIQGEVTAQSGSFLTFAYSEKEYATVPSGMGYIRLEDSLGALNTYEEQSPSLFWLFQPTRLMPRMRLTGRFQGSRFEPVQVDFCTDSAHNWQNILTLKDPGEEPVVTVYAWDQRSFRSDSKPVRMGGVVYENLTEYILGLDYENRTDALAQEESDRMDNLFDALICYGGHGKDKYGDYGFTVAVRCSPILYSVLRLWPLYLGSVLLLGLLLLLYLLWLKKRVTEPLESLGVSLKYGTRIFATGRFREIKQLQTLADAQAEAAMEAKNRLNQLQASLEYAQDGEKKRRQLVSDITHELKTPLAVIHSYAECLQEDIVPQKREEYLSVILEETRNMDAMVLQMLDLSRLEAGKVRLSRDAVSLLELAKGQLERFAPILEAKKLKLRWRQADAFSITADEKRMEQAVTNLLGNAVKYTPAGGEISVEIRLAEGEAIFSVENTARPLSGEALDKVWDSFYRADPARSEPGTGLGLSLVKNIIRLHGGACFVRNTSLRDGDSVETAVEFGFRIPLK